MRFLAVLSLLFSASFLSGCGGLGGDDVEVSLPFVGNIMAKAKSKDEKMANRGGLILPPAVKGLPAPLDQKQAANGGNSWPVDPDAKAKSDAEVAALAQKKYRREGNWSNKNNTGNGIEDFNNKTDWFKRQGGVLDSTLNNPANRE